MSEDKVIYIIGTIHQRHEENDLYPAEKVGKILNKLKPDALLLECDSSILTSTGKIKKQFREDFGSPELEYVHRAARNQSLNIIPIDRENREEYYSENELDAKSEKVSELAQEWFERVHMESPDALDIHIGGVLQEAMSAQGYLDYTYKPEVINSIIYDSVSRMKHSLWMEVLPKLLGGVEEGSELREILMFLDEEWIKRNEIMSKNILKVYKEMESGRIAVVVGAEHRYIIKDLLTEAGLNPILDIREYWEHGEV